MNHSGKVMSVTFHVGRNGETGDRSLTAAVRDNNDWGAAVLDPLQILIHKSEIEPEAVSRRFGQKNRRNGTCKASPKEYD